MFLISSLKCPCGHINTYGPTGRDIWKLALASDFLAICMQVWQKEQEQRKISATIERCLFWIHSQHFPFPFLFFFAQLYVRFPDLKLEGSRLTERRDLAVTSFVLQLQHKSYPLSWPAL